MINQALVVLYLSVAVTMVVFFILFVAYFFYKGVTSLENKPNKPLLFVRRIFLAFPFALLLFLIPLRFMLKAELVHTLEDSNVVVELNGIRLRDNSDFLLDMKNIDTFTNVVREQTMRTYATTIVSPDGKRRELSLSKDRNHLYSVKQGNIPIGYFKSTHFPF